MELWTYLSSSIITYHTPGPGFNASTKHTFTKWMLHLHNSSLELSVIYPWVIYKSAFLFPNISLLLLFSFWHYYFGGFLAIVFELRASHLLSRYSITFWLCYFSDGVSHFFPAAGRRLQSSYLCFSHSWDHRCVTTPNLSTEIGSH
jgi:hypothetical protein